MRAVRPPAVHWPSVRGRAVADAGPLLLAAAVVVVVSLLAGAVPPLLGGTADAAVHDAVRRAGDAADIRVTARWERDDGPDGGRVRAPRLAEDVDDFRDRATQALAPGLRAALRPPVAAVTSPILKITDGSVLRTFQLTYLADDGAAGGGPAVTWLAGGPPQAAVAPVDSHIEAPYDATGWPVQVGLSEAVADALHLAPGAHIPLEDDQRRVKNVQVSGVFRPTDSNDPGWRPAPWVLRPFAGADGTGSTRLAGLLSRESLPDARLAFGQDELERTAWFSPDPGALSWRSAGSLTTIVVALKATSGSSADLDSTMQWQTQLDGVLRGVRDQVDAATAQASVLLIGILTAAVLVLLLSADLLVRRRAPTLSAARRSGVALPDLGTELLLESVALAFLATGLGLALARAVAPGVAWPWALPVVLAAAGAGPAFGTLAAARATRDRRVPANRTARRFPHRTAQLRRAALDAAVLIAAVAALVALHQRGIVPPAPSGGAAGDATLPASAPTLGIVAGALLLLRLLPAGTRLALKRALRSRRPLAVFGTARAAETSGRVLPVLVLVTSAALASFALTLDATADQGLAAGAWSTVGADARLDVADDAVAATPALARRLAATPGVRQVVTGQITDRARVTADGTALSPRLVIVDARAFQRLLASTPLPDAPDVDRLVAPGHGAVPALVRSNDGSLRSGARLQLLRDGATAVPLVAVGAAPMVDDAGDVVLVDAAAIANAGLPVVPNTVWVTGPGATRAVAADVAGTQVVLRADVLRTRRVAPLTSGLLRLAWAAAGILLALGLLGLAIGAAADAPRRWQTLTRLRTLGLRLREARRVATAELLPPVAVAAVAGPLLGVLLARLTLGPLALRLLTGQATDPAPVLPWWRLLVVPATLLVALAVVVPVESAVRRRRQLSEVLRVGEG